MFLADFACIDSCLHHLKLGFHKLLAWDMTCNCSATNDNWLHMLLALVSKMHPCSVSLAPQALLLVSMRPECHYEATDLHVCMFKGSSCGSPALTSPTVDIGKGEINSIHSMHKNVKDQQSYDMCR